MPTIEQHFERTDPTVRVVYDRILETARRFAPEVTTWLERSYALAE